MVGNDDLGKENTPEPTGASTASDQSSATPHSEAPPVTQEAPSPGDPAAGSAPPAEVERTSVGGDAGPTPPLPRAPSGADLPTPAAPEPTPTASEPDWREQCEKTRNQLLRVAADFENYKKRSKRDAQDAAHRARDELLQEFLPVIDNLERALGHAAVSGNESAGGLVEGVQMVLRTFQAGMERFGVKGFEAVGQPFDPNLHEALSQRETSEMAPGLVLEEYRRGYLMGDRLLRPALVVVSKAAAPVVDAAVPVTEAAPGEAQAPGGMTEGHGAPSDEPPTGDHGGGSPEEGR